MIHINSYKLTPAITATWGDITGNVSNQEDLVEYINEHGTAAWGSISGNISDQSDLMSTLGSYATESWVSSQQFATESWVSDQGYLTSVPSEYATQSWVSEQGYLTSSALTGYATESWVSGQGYITSESLSGYATESWVSEQGYLTEHQPLKTVNNQSLVGEGNIEIGGLTPEQEEAIAPLVDKSTGVLTADVKTKYKYVGFAEAPSSDQYGQIWVYDINNNVYVINWMNLENNNTTPYIYKWNSETWKFELLTYNNVPVNITGAVPVISAVTDAHVIWCDSQGRYYFNNTHTITFTDTEWVFTEKALGGNLQTYNGKKCNIIKDANTGLEGVWMYYAASTTNGTAYKFNEETQEFESQGVFYQPRNTGFFRYGFYYSGRYYFTYPNTQSSSVKLYLITKSTTSGRAAQTAQSGWGIPSYVDVQEDGTTRRIYVTGDRIRTIVKNGETKYIFYYGQYAWMLNTESTPYTWDYLDLVRKDTFSYNTNGVEFGDLMFGFGYNDEVTGQVPVWNFSDKVIEDYGWDNSLDERLTAVEEIVPSAEVLTEASKGVLYTDEIEGNKLNYKNWSGSQLQPNRLYSMVDGSVYYLQFPALYKLNSDTMIFDVIVNVTESTWQPLWMDNSGRMFQGTGYEIDLTTGFVTSVNLNYGYFTYDRNRCNLFYGNTGIWRVSSDDAALYDEQFKQFSGVYTITLPQDYSGDIAFDICHIFTYKGHKLFQTTENKTYEVTDTYKVGLTVTDVTGAYFPTLTFGFMPYFIFPTEDGNLWYLNSYDKYMYTGTGTWGTPTITLDYPFNNDYVVSGNCVLGGVYQQSTKYTVINLGSTLKNTGWTSVNNVAVDLDSAQHISGNKSFDNIDIQNSGINYVYAPNGSTNINLGKNITSANKMEFTVPGMFTLNGENIATTDQCFVNRSYTTSGPRYEGICPTPNSQYQYQYFFKTPSGRLILDDGDAYEFDGTQFTQLQTVTVHPQGKSFVTITDGLFAEDNNGNLIKWNDTTSNWEVVIPMSDTNILWAADANTLRVGSLYKLDNTGGTYSWVEDALGSYPYIGHTYFIGQNVYMMQEGGNMVYQYDESTKTFTFIGNTYDWPNGNHWIVFENALYYFGGNGIHKIDPSQAGTDQWDVTTDILYTSWEALYVEYNNKLYLTNSNVTNNFGYCYDVTETTPTVPSTNGTYVLKAVRSGDQVTFSWVLES